ncbi:Vesicle-associated membrane protein 1 [Cichlidogyrus casuarinus]|uniref:Vesicle-associated membrane protein 1 n=1 Tax=Cichlidogyrus casuarinus TaxID=1844966 RepID=A0ABD2PRQ5_9PLAT
MASTEQEPSEKTASNPPPTNKRLQQTQAQVNEVVDIMRINVDKVLERDKNLSKLDNRADALQAGASQFEASAGKLKRKFWWRNCKMLLVLGTLATCLLIVIIVWIVTGQKKEQAIMQLTKEKNNSHLAGTVGLNSNSSSGGKSGEESILFQSAPMNNEIVPTPSPVQQGSAEIARPPPQ